MKTKQHLLFAALLLSCVTAGSLASHSFNSAENYNIANSRTLKQLSADPVASEFGYLSETQLRANTTSVSSKSSVDSVTKAKYKNFTIKAQFYTFDIDEDFNYYIGYSDKKKEEVNYKPATLVFDTKETFFKLEDGKHVIDTSVEPVYAAHETPIKIKTGDDLYSVLNSSTKQLIDVEFEPCKVLDPYVAKDESGQLKPTASKIDIDVSRGFQIKNIFTEVEEGATPVGETITTTDGKTLENNQITCNLNTVKVDIYKNSLSNSNASLDLGIAVNKTGAPLTHPYLVGWGTSKEDSESAKLIYFTKRGDEIKQNTADIKKKNPNAAYDVLTSSKTINTSVEFDIPDDETLLQDVYYIDNIYRPVKAEEDVSKLQNIKTDKNGIQYVKTQVRANLNEDILRTLDITEALTINYVGLTKYHGLGAVEFSVKNNIDLERFYSYLKPYQQSVFRREKENFESGQLYIRIELNFDPKTTMHVVYEDGSDSTFTCNEGTLILNKEDNRLVFLDSNFIKKPIKSITVDTFRLVLKTMDTITQQEKDIIGDVFIYKNYKMYDKNETNVGTYFNADAFVSGISVGYIVLYLGVSLVIFFYLKKKNADDIFKRVRPKPYWTNNIMGLVATGSLVVAVMSIVLRLTVLNNTLVVTNPIDILIVVFSIVALIFCGYFVKYFAVQIKNIKDKRMNEKLNSNKNYDDGTLLVSKSDKKGE